jgi:hypothetical protein
MREERKNKRAENREHRFNQVILDLIDPYYNYRTVAQLSIKIFFDFLFSATYDGKSIRLFFVNCIPISRYI